MQIEIDIFNPPKRSSLISEMPAIWEHFSHTALRHSYRNFKIL